MDTFKELISFTAAVVGLIAALIPLYARFADNRRQAARGAERSNQPQSVVKERFAAAEPSPMEVEDRPEAYAPPHRDDPAQVARARALVRNPAIALLVSGVLGLATNLTTAAFGYVDEFVTPLTTESQARWQSARNRLEAGGSGGSHESMPASESDRATVVLTIITMLSFAVASGMAIWAGYNMIRLRSHWLSMAGSIAVMPATCVCCMVGLPIGVWSLVVLLRPEVSSTFH